MDETYHVKKLNAPVHWVTEVPGSKSITNRALLMAALSDGDVTLCGVLFSDDSRYFLSSLKSLGFYVEIQEDEKKVIVRGCGGRIPNPTGEIYVGSAGTAARFLTAMLGVSAGTYVIQASEQMRKRPMKPLFEALLALGAKAEWLGDPWHLPVRITGAGALAEKFLPDKPENCDAETVLDGAVNGNCRFRVDESSQNVDGGDEKEILRHGKETILNLDISESTQFLSAFLLISPMFGDGLRIHITSKKTDGSYIRITRRMMADFSVEAAFDGRDYVVGANAVYQKKVYQIEPDVSAACYFYAAAAVTGGYAKVLHVHRDGMQGDLKFLSVLEQMGCSVREEPDGISVSGVCMTETENERQLLVEDCGEDNISLDFESVVCEELAGMCSEENGSLLQTDTMKSETGQAVLHGLAVNMNDFSDQALTLAAIAPYADAPVAIRNVAHIRGQECDRIHAMVSNLKRAGISCEEYPDGVKIYPGQPKPCRIETFGDHRVAMAFSVMGLRADGIEIENPMCCKKTFEHYFDVLDGLLQAGI